MNTLPKEKKFRRVKNPFVTWVYYVKVTTPKSGHEWIKAKMAPAEGVDI